MKVLGLETSCDETGVALFDEDRGIVAERLASQVALHERFGGVVPELASRDHIAKLAPMICEVADAAGIELRELDAIAYTAGPGLIGALLVGGAVGAALAYALGIPAIPVHHLEGHVLAAMLEPERPEFPFLVLLASGGHTQLIVADGVGRYRIVGATLDDAAGEAFDKAARLLSLPYPGGPAIAALAARGNPAAFALPRPLKGVGLDFSFSGLKTAVRLAVEAARAAHGGTLPDAVRADLAASFEAAVVDTLIAKCARALETTGLERLVIAGGVGANRRLRAELAALGERLGVRVYYPRPALCTDNAAMIAYAGWCRSRGRTDWPPRILARPRWPIDELAPSA